MIKDVILAIRCDFYVIKSDLKDVAIRITWLIIHMGMMLLTMLCMIHVESCFEFNVVHIIA